MKWRIILSTLFSLLIVTAVYGQVKEPESKERRVVWYTLQDSVKVNLYSFEAGKVMPAEDHWVGYSFHALYDSCRVVYRFGELQQGGERVEIDNWVYNRYIKEKTSEEISAISKSKPFVITGDEIFYSRVVEWFDPRPGKRDQLVDNFYCEDTLTYSVVAVNQTTQATEVIETLVVRSNNGHIWTVGGLPIEAVMWTPPGSWQGQTAYIDIRVDMYGPGLFYFGRSDDITGRFSVQLEEPFYSSYYRQFNESYPPSGSVQ